MNQGRVGSVCGRSESSELPRRHKRLGPGLKSMLVAVSPLGTVWLIMILTWIYSFEEPISERGVPIMIRFLLAVIGLLALAGVWLAAWGLSKPQRSVLLCTWGIVFNASVAVFVALLFMLPA